MDRYRLSVTQLFPDCRDSLRNDGRKSGSTDSYVENEDKKRVKDQVQDSTDGDGGDLYVGIMTVINSVREIITMPVTGLTSGAQPVMSFNYGARRHARVK